MTRLALALLVCALTGCAYMQLTPEQAQACSKPKARCRVLTIEEQRLLWDNARKEGYEAGKHSV